MPCIRLALTCANAILLLLAASTARATVWTLEDVRFDDGGTATGCYNCGDGWDIKVSGGDEGKFPAFEYTPATSEFVAIVEIFGATVNLGAPSRDNATRQLILFSNFDFPIPGQSALLGTVPTPFHGFRSEEFSPAGERKIIGGEFVFSCGPNECGVPEPPIWLLLPMIAGLLAFAGKRV